MPRITISIPAGLKQRLDDPRVRKTINVSRVCQEALSREIHRMLDLPLDLDLDGLPDGCLSRLGRAIRVWHYAAARLPLLWRLSWQCQLHGRWDARCGRYCEVDRPSLPVPRSIVRRGILRPSFCWYRSPSRCRWPSSLGDSSSVVLWYMSVPFDSLPKISIEIQPIYHIKKLFII